MKIAGLVYHCRNSLFKPRPHSQPFLCFNFNGRLAFTCCVNAQNIDLLFVLKKINKSRKCPQHIRRQLSLAFRDKRGVGEHSFIRCSRCARARTPALTIAGESSSLVDIVYSRNQIKRDLLKTTRTLMIRKDYHECWHSACNQKYA